ncbi:MAG: TonB-dependent receptor, partial [Candidatus Krumholzibacteriia bacterium]
GDVAGLLAAATGLHLRRYGGPGAESVPTIRGASGGQVALLVDGVPLADAQDGRIDLASLPLERFAAAEVYRGPAPSRFGGNGGAAAINLITRASGEAGVGARLFAGAAGDRGGRATAGWRSGDGGRSALLLLHGRTVRNDFRFLDHNQTFANPDDDRERTRLNADFAEWGGALSGRWDGGRLRGDGSVGLFRRDGGRPGPLGYESPHARVRRERQDVRLSLEDPRAGLRLDVAGARALELLHDDAGEVGWDPPGTTRSGNRDISGRLTVARAAALPGEATGRVQLTAGGDWGRQWYDERRAAVVDPLRVRTTVTAFATLRCDLYGPRLTVAPSWRWQRLTDNFPPLPALPWLPEIPLAAPHVQDAVSPSVAAVWEARPARLFLEAHASRALRAPTWVELFGHRGGVDGNRTLRPERVTARDAGLRWGARGGGRWARLALFTTVTDRAVVWVQNSQRTSQARNIGLTRADGVEWEAGGGAAGDARWSANVTWQDARDRGVDPAYRGRKLPFLPAVEASLGGAVPVGAWEAGAELTHESASWRDRYNTPDERAPARTLLSLSLARTWRPGAGRALTVTAELVNVTDNTVYDVEGFPLPGRTARVSLFAR